MGKEIKVTVELKDGTKHELTGTDALIVVKGLENNREGDVAFMLQGTLPFMIYAHDTLCEKIQEVMGTAEKKHEEAERVAEAFAEVLKGLFGAAPGSDGKTH